MQTPEPKLAFNENVVFLRKLSNLEYMTLSKIILLILGEVLTLRPGKKNPKFESSARIEFFLLQCPLLSTSECIVKTFSCVVNSVSAITNGSSGPPFTKR